MRINKYLAQATGMSRRAADTAIAEKRVKINGKPIVLGQAVEANDKVTLDDKLLTLDTSTQTILLNKPVGYVCSRDGQGSKTIYDLLPEELHHLKPVGRLDKDSSGLLLMTNDGDLAHKLTHPSFEKTKVYEIKLDKELTSDDFEKITHEGVQLEDGLSKFDLDYINDKNFEWKVNMHEGRNRQIRRTFEALGYKVIHLHRTHFGSLKLGKLQSSKFVLVNRDVNL